MPRTTRFLRAAAAAAALAATACHDDELFRPTTLVPVDPLFARYVSMGNSITAGYQSDGINDSTQLLAYPVLVARQMRSAFFAPLMNRPGCPPPYTNSFTGARVPPTVPNNCALRKAQSPPPPWINNVAVPGAAVIDAINNLAPGSRSNGLTTFFLGGLTQTQMLLRVNPTFVTVWLGNNDALGASLTSDTTRLTPTTMFEDSLDATLDAIQSIGAKAVLILVGIGDTFPLPYWSRGTTYYGADQAGQIPGPFTATANCAPPRGDSVLVPVSFGGVLIATGGTLDCTEPQTIQPAEYAKIRNTIIAYNTIIAREANDRGWTFLNLNPTFDSLRAVAGQVRALPNFGTACSTNPFGAAFSCDGIHPSSASHKLIANKLIQAVNTKYKTGLAQIP